MVVEDDPFLRDLYREILFEEGYSVDTASDGEEGFIKMKQGGWDLVLLDIILPKLDGFAIMNKIKSDPPVLPNKALVFLTNLDKDEEIKQALKYGDGYLIKSNYTPPELLNEIRQYLPSDIQ